jgi:hypothetical protein
MELISVDDFESHELAAQAEAPPEVTPSSVTSFQVA